VHCANEIIMQVNIVATATTAGVFLLCLSPRFSGECSAKTFELAVVYGCVQCAISAASQTTSLLDLPADNLPPQVRCARQCTSQAPCQSFNYRSDINACEFYNQPPTVLQPTANCKYFQVKALHQSVTYKLKCKLVHRY